MAKKLTQFDRKRLARRDAKWKDAADVIYNRRNESGWITIPRTLSMTCTLIKQLGEKNDPSRLYLELWCRQRDDGYVEIDDLDELAQASGFYRGATRRARSVREALDRLAELGFVRVASKGQRKYAFVLILHPHDVVQRMHHEPKNRIPNWWWDLFQLRVQDIGAELRWKPEAESEKYEDFPETLDEQADDLPF